MVGEGGHDPPFLPDHVLRVLPLLHRPDTPPNDVPRHAHASVSRGQVLQSMDGNGTLTHLRVVVSRHALSLCVRCRRAVDLLSCMGV